jgi:hypothetical protein
MNHSLGSRAFSSAGVSTSPGAGVVVGSRLRREGRRIFLLHRALLHEATVVADVEVVIDRRQHAIARRRAGVLSLVPTEELGQQRLVVRLPLALRRLVRVLRRTVLLQVVELVAHDRRRRVGGAVAVNALDRDRVARLTVQLAVGVHIELEVAVDALHSHLEVDVLEMDRHLRRRRGVGTLHPSPQRRRLELRGRHALHRLVVRVEQSALAVLLEDRAKDPAVAVEVGELRVPQLVVQVCRQVAQEVGAETPVPRDSARRGKGPTKAPGPTRLPGYACTPPARRPQTDTSASPGT